jgi:hypothetical protein
MLEKVVGAAVEGAAAAAGASWAERSVESQSRPIWQQEIVCTTLAVVEHRHGVKAVFELLAEEDGRVVSVGGFDNYPQATARVGHWRRYIECGGSLNKWLAYCAEPPNAKVIPFRRPA